MHSQLKMETKTIFHEYKEENQLYLISKLTLEKIAPVWAARLGTERKFPPLCR